MRLESPSFTHIRNNASLAVDQWYRLALNQALADIELARSLPTMLNSIEITIQNTLAGNEQLFSTYSDKAFVHGYHKGFEDVGGDKIIAVYIENGIWDTAKHAISKSADRLKSLTKKVADKSKTTAQSTISSIRSSLQKAIKKILPKHKDNQQFSKTDTAIVKELAKKIVAEELNKLDGKTKKQLQDEITASAADGKLDAYTDAGIKLVKVRIDTVKDERRCKHCAGLDGKVYNIEQARGMIPAHPNCRCMWRFVNNDHVTKELKREQKQQEVKVHRLRDRLDKNYIKKRWIKDKAVHNQSNIDYDLPDLTSCEIPFIVNVSFDIIPDTKLPNTGLTVKPVRIKKGKTGLQVICSNDIVATGFIPANSILKLKGKLNNNIVYEFVGNLGEQDIECKKYPVNFVSLLPDSFDGYPYELYRSGDFAFVMDTNSRGHIEVCG